MAEALITLPSTVRRSRVKFWFIKNYMSPQMRAFVPHMAAQYDFDFEFVTYKWPSWLHKQASSSTDVSAKRGWPMEMVCLSRRADRLWHCLCEQAPGLAFDPHPELCFLSPGFCKLRLASEMNNSVRAVVEPRALSNGCACLDCKCQALSFEHVSPGPSPGPVSARFLLLLPAARQ